MYSLRCCTWNANGLRNHIGELRNFICHHRLDLITVNETKLTEDIKIKIKDFQIFRKDRTAHGGGVAIIVRNNIPLKLLTNHIRTSIEHIAIQLKDNTCIIAVYNQPRNQLTIDDIQSLTNIGNKVLIVGDLNARHYTWMNHVDNHNGVTLFNSL